jgi:hypothetical protein
LHFIITYPYYYKNHRDKPFVAINSFAVIKTENKSVAKLIQIENAGKNKLYAKANNLKVSAFNNEESVIKFTDK